MRAISGVNTKPITMISVRVDGPSATMNRKATITTGSASTASTIRLAMVSVQPLMYPIASPRAVPSTVPSSVASGRDDEDAARADDDAREDVTAELVGAEPVRPGRAVVHREQVLAERIVRCERLAQDRAQRPRSRRSSRRPGTSSTSRAGAAARPAPAPAPASTAPRLDGGARGAHSPPPKRMRGLSIEESDVGDQRGHHVHDPDREHARLEHREVLLPGRP